MKNKKSSVPDSDVVFIGWMERLSGGAIRLYNVTKAGHPLHGSTVSDNTLRKLNLQPPQDLPTSEDMGNSPATQQGEQNLSE